MGIMDAFRNITGTGNPTPVAATAVAQPGAEANTMVPNGATPKSDGSMPAIPAVGEGDKSPLAEYDKLWSTPDPKTKPASPSELAINIQTDPTKLLEAAKRVDFSKVIPAELAGRMAKGEGAAILEGMNLVSQASYAQSVGATGAILREALAQQARAFETKVIPEVLRNHEARRTLQADNQLFRDPAVAPLVDMVERQLAQHNPSMSATEISEKAKGYLSGFATDMIKQSGKVISDAPVASTAGRQDTDWSKFFGEDAVA